MKLSKNFTLAEFASHDGAPVPADVLTNLQELAKNLQVLRDYLNTPLKINSGYRSPAHNKAVGGAQFSQHMLGKAADISSNKYTPEQIHAAILHLIKEGKIKDGGLGRYDSFTHYDIANSRRWDLRKHKSH